MTPANARSTQTVALTLSGGGFRAALFHLGVLRFLRDSRLLRRVESISAVSGGSIIGAYCILHWDELTGTEEQFLRVADRLVAFVKSDVRGRVVRRWLLARCCLVPWVWCRESVKLSQLLMSAYEGLYQNSSLKDLRPKPGQAADRPRLSIASVSLTSGDLCGFGDGGFTVYRRSTANTVVSCGLLPLAFAVAASSAFPPLFPAIRVDSKVLRCDVRMFPTPEWLSDGGVFDNSGLELMRAFGLNEAPIPTIVVSDAGSGEDWLTGSSFRSLLRRNMRANSLLRARASELILGGARAIDAPVTLISLSDVVPMREAGPDEEIQRSVRRIRTDLDAFSDEEIGGLIRQGYLSARLALKGGRLLTEGQEADHTSEPAFGIAQGDRQPVPATSERRRIGLWNPRDWTSWALAGVTLIWLLGILLMLRGL